MNYRKIYLGIAQNINIIATKAKESHANILTSLYSLTNFSIFSSFSFSVPLFIFLPLFEISSAFEGVKPLDSDISFLIEVFHSYNYLFYIMFFSHILLLLKIILPKFFNLFWGVVLEFRL